MKEIKWIGIIEMNFPRFSKQAAEFLLDRNIAGIGIATVLPDGTNKGFPVHKLM